MCWITQIKENEQPLVAEKDIRVLKFFRAIEGRLKSPILGHQYEIGKAMPRTNIVTKFLTNDIVWYTAGSCYIEEGYHSYQYGTVSKNVDGGIRYTHIRYKDGKEVYYDCGFLDLTYNTLYECVIPKGTKYYVNENHEIVSETIIVRKPVNTKKLLDFLKLKERLSSLLNKESNQ